MDKKTAIEAEPVVVPLRRSVAAAVSIATAIIYYFSNPRPQSFYDYTFRVAENLLRGKIAFVLKQPGWLNEFVPFEGFYYSVFPLGAVLSMLPFAALKSVGVIDQMPGAFIAAMTAGLSCWLLLTIGSHYDIENKKRVLLALAILFGTFAWTNLTFDGAWQLALGFAMLGEIGAIYFTVFDRRPVIAGIFFAMAFGNRTECLLTAPIFFYLLARVSDPPEVSGGSTPKTDNANPPVTTDGSDHRLSGPSMRRIAYFCAVPCVLGVATLIYNYVRFHSFTDFGYARIPGVLSEPWYDHGIFSLYYIPRQAWEMLLKLWEWKAAFPYLIPNGFSASILISSPFLVLIARYGSKDKVLKHAAWAAIVLLTFLLWIHGNSGGWQFAYRYAMVLLPWVFVVLLESSPKRVTALEWALYSISFLANAYATWLFHWTEYVKP